jgi:hypothetical protein
VSCAFVSMADDLSNLWENFSLNDDEEIEVAIEKGELKDGEAIGRSCVLGKLITDRMVGREAIQTKLTQWWKMWGKLSFKILGENTFLIEFEDPRDKVKVLAGRPWAFENNLFIIEDFDGLSSISNFTFEKEAFWVRMFDLPLACMGMEIGRKIGATVGVVEAVDTDSRGIGWGEYLRVKILLDITKPLPRGRKINIEGKSSWIRFQYERLPKFCFQCGAIAHSRTGYPRKTDFRQQGMS